LKAELVRTFRFNAAHSLTNVPTDHKCASLHGHSFRVDVHVIGEVDLQAGWLMDFAQINKAVQPAIDRLDHCLLNEVQGLSNPTSELLASWLWEQIRPQLPQLSAIVVYESESAKCIYRGT